VTNDVEQRVHEHKTKLYQDSFTAKYWRGLFCYEEFCNVEEVIKREMQQKNTKEHLGLT
jgi:predicted GIY-YIG superfamily endonuclease